MIRNFKKCLVSNFLRLMPKVFCVYSPSNANLNVVNFTAFLDSIDAKNTLVAQKYEEYDDALEARLALYNNLADRLTKIKLALAAQYGKTSNVYIDAVAYM